MSFVSWTPYLPGEPRDITRYNQAVQDMVDRIDNLQPLNFAQEGLTRRELSYKPREQVFRVQSVTRGAPISSSAFQTFEHDGTPFEYTGLIPAGDPVLMRYRLTFTARETNQGFPPLTNVRVRLRITEAGNPTFTAHERAKLTGKYHGAMWGSYLYTGGVALSNTLTRVALEFNSFSGTLRPHYCLFYGERQLKSEDI